MISRGIYLGFFVTVVFFFFVNAQRSQLGFCVGTLNYTGDLVRNYNLAYSKPAGTVFYRANLNKAVSFKASIVAGKIGADDGLQLLDADQGLAQFLALSFVQGPWVEMI